MHGFLVILPVVLVMAAGRMLARRGVVSPGAFAQINKAIYWTAIPALILRMTSRADMSTLADRNMVVAVYLSFLAAPPAAWLAGMLAGQERRRTASSTLMLIRSNTVFVGLPVVTVAVGIQGVEVLSLYLAFTFIGYQIISISWAQLALSGGISWNTVKGTLKSMAKNPLVLSSLAGFTLAVTGLNSFPVWLDETLKLLGNIASGTALLSLGATLKLEALTSMLPRAWRDVALKLLFLPALTWGLFLLFPVNPVVFRTVILIAAMPVAVDCFILSQVLGMDSDQAAAAITASTLLSGLTVPLWITLLEAFLP